MPAPVGGGYQASGMRRKADVAARRAGRARSGFGYRPTSFETTDAALSTESPRSYVEVTYSSCSKALC
jgi:hypothetical protein